jgi:hypothetical protein
VSTFRGNDSLRRTHDTCIYDVGIAGDGTGLELIVTVFMTCSDFQVPTHNRVPFVYSLYSLFSLRLPQLRRCRHSVVMTLSDVHTIHVYTMLVLQATGRVWHIIVYPLYIVCTRSSHYASRTNININPFFVKSPRSQTYTRYMYIRCWYCRRRDGFGTD